MKTLEMVNRPQKVRIPMNKIVGIDLGTTFSAISQLSHSGKPEIAPLSDGERIIASAIYFDNDTTLVGEIAKNKAQIDANRYADFIKRYMGEEHYPHMVRGKQFTPSELSSIILAKIKHDYEQLNGPIESAIITVPAYFDETRRQATMDAARLAKIPLEGIINEPTAAGLYYASLYDVEGKTLVFDLGGGTFDVTMLDIFKQDGQIKVEIITSQGDHQLGGKDFDFEIANDIDRQYEAEYGVQYSTSPEKKYSLVNEAEIIKKELSKLDEATRVIYGEAGSIQYTINRRHFEDLIAPFFAKIEMLIENVIEDSEVDTVDQILLVGGSSRIPLVNKTLQSMFKITPLKVGNLDESVSLGAAIYCGLQNLEKNSSSMSEESREELGKLSLTDVANHSYGTISLDFSEEYGQQVDQNTFIIPKNTKLPAKITKTFYTVSENQTKLEMTVTQGESTDPYGVNILAQRIMELPGGRPKHQPVEITYSYDKNQRMKCEFHDVNANIRETIEIDTNVVDVSESSDVEDMINF